MIVNALVFQSNYDYSKKWEGVKSAKVSQKTCQTVRLFL